MITYPDTSTAYLDVVRDVLHWPEYISMPRGMKIHEKLAYSFRVSNPTSTPIVTHDEERNLTIASYTEKERILYDSGSRSVEDFSKISSFWRNLANPDGTVNSAYGNLIFCNKDQGNIGFDNNLCTPWEWALESLVRDKDTRQAVIRFNRSEHLWSGNKDVVCTMYGIFHLREGKLNLTVRMRSNDVFYGLVYDLPWFCGLIERMCHDLGKRGIEAKPGYYTHSADSMHAYERNFADLTKMITGVANA